MARSAAQFVFVALLALLSSQAAVPSRDVTSPAKIVWCAETDQQAPEQSRPARVEYRGSPVVVEYTSQIGAPPDAAALFQRPPPDASILL